MGLSCQELCDEWSPHQSATGDEWTKCGENVKANCSPDSEALLESCPLTFSATMVDDAFGQSSLLACTSSIFATEEDDVDELHDSMGTYDRDSNSKEGVHDAQWEDFGSLHADEALHKDVALGMPSLS
jgi:hypothetical protein